VFAVSVGFDTRLGSFIAHTLILCVLLLPFLALPSLIDDFRKQLPKIPTLKRSCILLLFAAAFSLFLAHALLILWCYGIGNLYYNYIA
jgi:hypothetical protein